MVFDPSEGRILTFCKYSFWSTNENHTLIPKRLIYMKRQTMGINHKASSSNPDGAVNEETAALKPRPPAAVSLVVEVDDAVPLDVVLAVTETEEVGTMAVERLTAGSI